MLINLKILFRLPVYTVSGMRLGRVKDAELDIESHQVRKYIVLSGLFGGTQFLVTPAQVKTITADKIVVDDAVSKETKISVAGSKRPQPALGAATPMSRE